ncbi:DUF1620-domain-containing protein [Testicularia cyperi]|uniref:ER membrane protein complex subunit 1 n=1 Tax=Testicularia cyperi TaxID=1882483 RepID=A0A317XKK5_9BASI|nr:DUF1620-domain-containing protein [Testicularia cyperi]
MTEYVIQYGRGWYCTVPKRGQYCTALRSTVVSASSVRVLHSSLVPLLYIAQKSNASPHHPATCILPFGHTSWPTTSPPPTLQKLPQAQLAVCLISLSLVAPVRAVSKSEAGKIDWHVPRIGVPHVSNTSATPYLAPRFHRILRPDADVKDKAQTAIFVATESNAVGALNPRNGAIVWRQIFSPNDQLMLQKQFGETALVVSGNGGANVRLFHAFTGFLIWETRQHPSRDGLLPETGVPGTDAAFLRTGSDPPADIVTIANARIVRRLDGKFGREVWRWEPEDDISRRSLIRVVPNKDKVHVVSLLRNTGSGLNSISVSTLSANNGQLLTTHEITSSVRSAADVIILPWNQLPNLSPTANPGAWVAWLNKDGTVRAAPLDPPNKRLAQPQVVYPKRAEETFTSIVDPGLGDKGLFVARRSDGLAEVMRLSADAKFTSFWEFEESAYDSVYAGTYDRQGNAFLQRIFFQRSQHLLNMHFLWADAKNGGEGQVSGFSFQWDHDLHGNVLGAAFEASQVSQYQIATRTVLTTSSGSIRMVLEDQHQWILEEGMSQTTNAVLIELPERKLTTLEGGAASLDHEGFVGRLIRHIVALQNLPDYAVAFATRFVTGSYGSLEQFGLAPSNKAAKMAKPTPSGAASESAVTMVKEGNKPARTKKEKDQKPSSLAPRIAAANTTSHLFRDPFGFRKLAVLATSKGKIYALDTLTNDAVVWEKSLIGYGDGEGEIEPKVQVKLMQNVREHSTDGRSPLLAIVAEIELQPGLISTRVFQLNPLTGDFLNDASSGQTVFLGACKDAFLLPASVQDPKENQNALGLVDQFDQLYLFPDTLAVAESFEPLSDRFFFSTREETNGAAGGTKFIGHVTVAGLGNVHKSSQVWSLPLPQGERIVDVIDGLSRDAIASYGRVLGDRSTLYKYLNPHARVITTVSPALNQAHVYLIDTITGAVLHEALLEDVDTSLPFKANFAENWITYTYSVRTKEEGVSTRVVTTELFEAPAPKAAAEDNKSKGSKPKDASTTAKTRSWTGLTGNFSSFVGESTNLAGGILPVAYSQTFLMPGVTIQALGSTSTKFGISLKNLIVSTDCESIVSIPRRLLEPRRPIGKPNKTEAEEFMVPYAPVLDTDPKWVISHLYPTANIERIATAPSLIESTTVVYAYGLDSFSTRLAPSGQFDLLKEEFNKPQLLLTLALLSAAILFTKPMVRNKTLSLRW